MKKTIKLLDEAEVQYDKNRMNEIEALGVGTIASVVSVPMINGITMAIKIVDKGNLERQFLADISIFNKTMRLVSIFKPKLFELGVKTALDGLLQTIIKEFDLRYEAENTVLQ